MLCGDIPLDQCLCDRCENCEQLLKSLLASGVKGIPSNRYRAVDAVVCSDHMQQVGSDFKFPSMRCLSGDCESCGTEHLATLINTENENLSHSQRITWHRWMKKNGKSAHEKVQIRGTIKQAIDELLKMLETLKNHLFRSNWHRNLFDHIRKNLKSGYIVQIFDFAMNYQNIYQDEVQSANWNSTQTSIHAIINYFLCPNENCNKVVTLNLVQISEDKHHDSFLAHAAHDVAFRYLAQMGLSMDMIIQFCDNCSGQYKSRRSFAELARSPLQIIRVFFGEKHGKSHCDAFFGCLKAWMTHKIKSRQVIITSAHDFFRFCQTDYETPPAPAGTYQHYRVMFQYLRPSDVHRHQDCNLDQAVPGTMKIYSVRNTEYPFKLKLRSVPCLCSSCVLENGDPCNNSSYTDNWQNVDLIPVKGDRKPKHQKCKHPKDCVQAVQHRNQNTRPTQNTCDDNDDDEDSLPLMSFERDIENGRPRPRGRML